MKTDNVNNENVVLAPELQEVDRAIAADNNGKKAEREANQARIRQSEERKLSLSRLLRIMGSAVLVAAALTFMLQEWEASSHTVRYFMFLGFTAVLSAAGFFCGIKIKEDKGARAFLAISAAVIPVHFSQLGALIFSKFGTPNLHYPAYAHWVAPNTMSALLTSMLAILALVPIAWIAFTTLARSEAKIMTLVFILSNALLLIPSREPDLMAFLGLMIFLFSLGFDVKYMRKRATLKTKEGLLARSLLCMPFFFLIGRTIHLYEISTLFVSMLFACIAVLFYGFIPKGIQTRRPKVLIHRLSIIPAGMSWLLLAIELSSKLNIGRDYFIPFIAIPYVVVLLAMSLRSESSQAFFQKVGALVAIGSAALQLLSFPGVFSSLLLVMISILTAAYGQLQRSKAAFLGGILGLVFGLLYHLKYAVELYTLSPWLSLGVLGLVTIIASSYIERHHAVLAERVGRLRNDLKNWD